MIGEKIPFWKKIIISIKDFERYIQLAAQPAKSTIAYIAILVAIFTLVISGIGVYNISKQINEVYKYIENEIEQISFKDGILDVQNDEGPIIIENDDSVFSQIIVDTSDLETKKHDEYVDKVKNGILILKDEVIVKSEMSNAIVSYPYNEITSIKEFDKDYILQQFSGTSILVVYITIFIMVFIYLFMIYIVNNLLNIALLAGLGYFTARLLKLRLRYSAMCNIATYSLTLPIILNIIYVIVNAITGFEIKYFDIMYIAVSYIYIITAILLLKADLIKKGKELNKIIEEQEKVRLELERQKEEEERKKQQEKDEEEKKKQKEKEEKDKKEKQDNKGKGKIGSEPQGDNV